MKRMARYRPNTMNVPSMPPEPAPYTFPYGFAGGVNLAVTPDQASPNQSPNMLNMNFDAGGKMINRKGFDAVNGTSWGATPIQGMGIFRKSNGSTVTLVAWGGKVYSFNAETGEKTDLCTGIKTTLADAPTYFFTMNGKCYIYNGTDYCYYDGVNPVADVTGIAYIPVLTLGRAPAGGGTIFEDLNYLSDSWIDCFSGTADATDYTVSFSNLTSGGIVKVDGVVKTETTDYTVNLTTGVYSFNVAPGEGINNVTIQSTKTGLMDATYITKCIQFEIYGGKNDNRVFAVQGNTRYHSGLNDPTYWPESNYAAITSDAEDITGLGKMIDYLVNLKERSLTFTYANSDASGNVLWPVYPLNDEYGCIAKDSIQPVNNGLIFLAGNKAGAPVGVVFLSPSTVRGQLNVNNISENINRSYYKQNVLGLLDESVTDLQNAKSWIYDNKYWLRVGTRCWILDLENSSFAEGFYCWYPYDGIPAEANCFLTLDKNLYLGSKSEGSIYKGIEKHTDLGNAFTSYWTSPVLFMDTYDWIKKWKSVYLTFTTSGIAEYTLTVITEEGEENTTIRQSAGVFSYDNFSYGAFTYGNSNKKFPAGQSEKVGNKGAYLQFRITNETAWEMCLLGVAVYYKLTKKVR